MHTILNGVEISNKIKEELKFEVASLNINPCIAFILVGNDPASEIYIKNKRLACKFIGIKSICYTLSHNVSENELIDLINKLNLDKNINGILVQHPLPNHINENKISNLINFKKDIDCFNPYNIGFLIENSPIFYPCTPSACIELLNRYNISLEGKICTVIGRSNIVGKPLANMLINQNATVISTNSKTKDIKSLTLQSDIIITAVGKPNFLTGDMIKEQSIVLDVGINRTNNKIVGDVCFDECSKKTSFITPVPGGIGPMTIAMLMKNCLKAFKIQNNI